MARFRVMVIDVCEGYLLLRMYGQRTHGIEWSMSYTYKQVDFDAISVDVGLDNKGVTTLSALVT